MARSDGPENHPDASGPAEHPRSAAPFMIALVVVVVLIVGVVLVSVLSSPEDNTSESDRVGTLITQYVTARSDGDDAAIAGLVCDDPPTDQPFTARSGEVSLENIERIDMGDDETTATASAKVKYGDDEVTESMSFRKVGDDWTVCGS